VARLFKFSNEYFRYHKTRKLVDQQAPITTSRKKLSLWRYSSKPETHLNNKISFYASQKTPCTYITISSLLMFFGGGEATYSVYHMHLIDTIFHTVEVSYFYGYAGMQRVHARPSCNPYSPQ
jgi:hypothetical protein